MRLLGIDFGLVRTGLALSDPLGVTCRPLDVINESDPERLIDEILARVAREEVSAVVVGLPRPLSGGTNSYVEGVLAFVEKLRSSADVPVITWDERFTTRLAEQGASRQTARDAVAACYMLQNYLDAQKVRSGGGVP